MDDRQTSKWIVAATCSTLVLLMAVGGVFALRDQLFAQARADAAKQSAERDKLASRIAALETVSSGSGTSDPAASEQTAALHAQIDELTKRLEALEQPAPVAQKAEPAPPTPPPPAPTVAPVAEPAPLASKGNEGALLVAAIISGKPYDASLITWQKDHPKALDTAMLLQPFAEKGLPSEQELISNLREQLEAIPASETEEPGGLVSKLNTHLAGMVSIKKTNRDPYATLRAQVMSESTATLLHSIDQLPEAERKPFTEWRDLARARAAVIAALPDIAAGDAP